MLNTSMKLQQGKLLILSDILISLLLKKRLQACMPHLEMQ